MRNSDYTELLTTQEIESIVNSYMRTPNAKPENVPAILEVMGFYAEHQMIASAILSGDLVITGVDGDGLKYCLSEKARKRLH